MRIAALALCFTLLTPPALAQTSGCNGQAEKATEPFVRNFHLAAASLAANNYRLALTQTDAAFPHALTISQLQAVLTIRMESQIAIKDDSGLAPTLQQRIALGCLRDDEVDLLPKLLDEAQRRLSASE